MSKHCSSFATRIRASAIYFMVMALAVSGAVGSFAAPPASPGARWIESWGESPQQPVDPVFGGSNPPTLSGQTVREVEHLSAGGTQMRLRLSNEYTDAPTDIGAVQVAMPAAGSGSSAINPGTNQVVTFGGSPTVTLAPNAAVLSDPIDLPVSGGTDLSVSIYVANATAPATLHSLATETVYAAPGNQVAASQLSGAATGSVRYLLTGIDVLAANSSATIVALGDSITDGALSSLDANRRWPDDLARRIAARVTGRVLAVSNQGIGGNRLLQDGSGPNAQSRFDRDVLARSGVRYAVLLEGINDIGFSASGFGAAPTVAGLIQADRQLIQRAHEVGVRLFGGTLTPYQGAVYATPEGEAVRGALNDWIRTSGEFDGVIDFDAAIRDPGNPLQMLPVYDSGDHLHPNDAGYQAMANAVDLRLFQLPPYHP